MDSWAMLIVSLLCLAPMLKQSSGQNPDVGRLFIGDPADGATPSVSQYTFSNYDRTGKSLSVYGLVFSGGNPSSTVPRTENVVVTCSVISTGGGFSDVSFSGTSTLTPSQNSTTVGLNLGNAGRGAEVVCSGNSESGTTTCPAGAGGPQFCPDTSQSNVVSVVVLPVATVSICEQDISVQSVENRSQSFRVQLSEVAVGNVNVDCRRTAGGLTLAFDTLTVAAGNIDGLVTYRLQPGRTGNQATVVCTARSLSNTQFATATSASKSADFHLQVQAVAFQPVYSHIYNTTFVSLLTLRIPVVAAAEAVNVRCEAKLMTSLDAAMVEVANPNCTFATSPTTVAPPISGTTLDPNVTVTPGPPDPTSDWYVVNSTLDINARDSNGQNQYRAVVTRRLRPPTDTRTEVVVTTCCSTDVSRQNDISAAAVAVVRLSPFPCQTCNVSEETSSTPQAERKLQNPGYVELAPCPCNLHKDVCDINCCCDSDCSERQVQTRFSGCIPGLAGGQGGATQDYKCDTSSFNPPDWHRLTCVYWENNESYLGKFYMNQDKLTTWNQVSAAVSGKYKGRFSLKETERRSSTAGSDYTYGTAVTTQREDLSSNALYSTGVLALPLANSGEVCNPLTPVRYLVDASSTCAVTMTADLCSASSVFSGQIYAVSSLIDGCGQAFKVTSKENGEVAVADVRYYTASSTDLLIYTGGTAFTPAGPQQVSNFPPDLEGFTCEDGCSPEECWKYNTGREVPPSVPPLPTARPPWDTGFDIPPSPIVDVVAQVCQNAVLEVRYNFEWSGNSITKLTADVVLGAVPLGNVVGQKFSVSWLNQRSNSSQDLSDNFSGTDQAYERSGAGGYDVGLPLISGCMNDSFSDTVPVDTASEKQMAVWKPGVNGLCANATRLPLTFGEDTMSSCMLRLTFDDLNNTCQALKDQIMNHMNVLFAANVLGKSGSVNPSDPQDWVTVIRRNLTHEQLLATTASPTTTLSPSGTTEAFGNETEGVPLEEMITGVCQGVPEGVQLIVLYAEAGVSNYVPRLEVVGAYINYTYANWSMNCAGINSRRCQSGSHYTQSFFLRSSTRFIKVPANPERKISFYTRLDLDNCDSDTCYRFAADFAQDVCYYDICWRELAYPLTVAYRGEESRYFNMALFLVLLLGVVGYAAVAKPGWS